MKNATTTATGIINFHLKKILINEGIPNLSLGKLTIFQISALINLQKNKLLLTQHANDIFLAVYFAPGAIRVSETLQGRISLDYRHQFGVPQFDSNEDVKYRDYAHGHEKKNNSRNLEREIDEGGLDGASRGVLVKRAVAVFGVSNPELYGLGYGQTQSQKPHCYNVLDRPGQLGHGVREEWMAYSYVPK